MSGIFKDRQREIIEDFATDIDRSKNTGPKPSTYIINFRNNMKDKIETEVFDVPIGLLRYRKDNGRIASDVMSYEKNSGRLEEKSQETQNILRGFLEEKDKEKTEELELSVRHDGQREPAIITCDGFLINGNRRKMVFEKLQKTDSSFERMRVVILPGEGAPGGPPTLREIEQIENRYQLQSDGKSEYYSFDKALSTKRKISLGISLKEQLRDDPKYSHLPEKELNAVEKQMESEFIKPLECVDEYLSHFDREGLYDTISGGISDREGRWQAFLDYSKFHSRLMDEKQRIKDDIKEIEIGKIKDAVFKIIRKREIPHIPITKVHQIMRELPKWLQNKEAKKELLKLSDEPMELSQKEKLDKNGKEFTPREIDRIWGEKFQEPIINHVKKAYHIFHQSQDRETPINLLEASLLKLNHKDMNINAIKLTDIPIAMKITQDIQEKAHSIEKHLYKFQKEIEELEKKHKKK